MNEPRRRFRYSLAGLLAIVGLSALIFSIVIPHLKAPLSPHCVGTGAMTSAASCYQCHQNSATVSMGFLPNRPAVKPRGNFEPCAGTGRMSSNCTTCHKAYVRGT